MACHTEQETQTTISNWANDTFGPAHDPAVLVTRAMTEMDELLEAVQEGNAAEIGSETADIVILLMRLLEKNGLDLMDEVTKKMQINRARTWAAKGDGTGKHVS